MVSDIARMKDRPILFSAPMVRALLDGSKTQTRRVVKPPFAADAVPEEMSATNENGHQVDGHSGRWWCSAEGNADAAVRCPFGIPGDRLWVRETWRVGAWHGPAHDRSCDRWIAVDYKADNHARREWLSCGADDRLAVQSTADARSAGMAEVDGRFQWEPGQSPCRWRPSIHMPRWASRINLEVTRVRVERLIEISEADAKAEGVMPDKVRQFWLYGADETRRAETYRHAAVRPYRALWEQINGPASWHANPWVWVVEFKRVLVDLPDTLQAEATIARQP